jgi:formylglycine-generating enzyme required for sulfatase activity
MNRREFIRTATTASFGLGLSSVGYAQSAGVSAPGSFVLDPTQNVIPAPQNPSEWGAFREQLALWRAAKRRELAYSDALYRRPAFAWVSRCFSCFFLMLCDQRFYDHRRGRYRVEAFLAEAQREFGGFDAIVLWHAYPRIGADDRNQFDCYRDQPGGLAGLRAVSRELRRHGVAVFIDYNPWDTGTRREGASDLDALAMLVGAIGADGIFLDTMSQGAAAFRAVLDTVRPGVALEGELALPLEHLHNHQLSWAQWFSDGEVPGVLRNKWFERRHLQHQIKRWDRDHTGELHCAWMNGSGMMVWDNVFGSWVGWCERDKAILRAMLPIQRRYTDLFCGEGWTPLVPTAQPGLYASLWELPGRRLWTLVNRRTQPVEGTLLRVALGEGERVYDLIRGGLAQEAVQGSAKRENRHAQPQPVGDQDTLTPVAGSIPGRGIGAFLAAHPQHLGADFAQFLARQTGIQARTSEDRAFPVRPTVLVSPPKSAQRAALPPNMARIPGGRFKLRSVFRLRECGCYESVHTSFSGTNGPRLHEPITFGREVVLAPYALDLTPVTNGQFAEFLRRSGYRPRDRENFLKHWQGNVPPTGYEDHPVVYVDLADARAYARWAGRRLPTEDEWQYAAQGPDGLRYPWGNEFDPTCCNVGKSGGTTRVLAYPQGRSPFGCYDLCGNVWEVTESERTDGSTRFCLLKGGSFYRAEGSAWYFDGGPQPNEFVAKFLLTWPGLDRCATIGFRCATALKGA